MIRLLRVRQHQHLLLLMLLLLLPRPPLSPEDILPQRRIGSDGICLAHAKKTKDNDDEGLDKFFRTEYDHSAAQAPSWAQASPDPVHAWMLSRITLDHAVDHLVRKGADILGASTFKQVAAEASAADQPPTQQQQQQQQRQEEVSKSLHGLCTASAGANTANTTFKIITAEFGLRLRPRPWPNLLAGRLVIEAGTGCEVRRGAVGGPPPLEESVVLVRRGGCSFEEKARAAEQSGALAILVANFPDEPQLMPMSAAPPSAAEIAPLRGYAAMLHHADAMQLEAAGANRVECAVDVASKWALAYANWVKLIAVDYQQHQAITGAQISSTTTTTTTTTTTSGTGGGVLPPHDPQLETLFDELRQRAYAPIYQLIAPHLSHMLAAFARVATNPAALGSPSLSAEDVRVVVLVFYGRRRLFQIMHLYLEQNLRIHGGVIDEVRLVPNTVDPDDLRYMHRLLDEHAWYRLSPEAQPSDVWERDAALYGRFYADVAAASEAHATTRTVFVKMDDDIVYIAPGAVKALVDAKLQASRRVSKDDDDKGPVLFVSANVVNHPRLSHRHQKAGLIRPFGVMSKCDATESRSDETPVHTCNYSDDPFGRTELGDWRCAAAIHESFLADLEGANASASGVRSWSADLGGTPCGGSGGRPQDGATLPTTTQTCIDAFVRTRPLNHTATTRWSINAFALEAADLAAINNTAWAAQFLLDDERFLSDTYPTLLGGGRRSVVATKALMVHYSYRLQMHGWCNDDEALGDTTITCDAQDYGGLDLHVGDAILNRYLAIAMQQSATRSIEFHNDKKK